jgi:two-component system, OmpR family, sensor kinase
VKPFFQSIRWQFQAWNGLLLLLLITGFGLIVYQITWQAKLAEVDNRLNQLKEFVVSSFRKSLLEDPNISSILSLIRLRNTDKIPEFFLERLQSGDLEAPQALATAFTGSEPGFVFFRIFDREGTIILKSENAPASNIPGPLLKEGADPTFLTSPKFRKLLVKNESGLRMIIGQDLALLRAEMKSVVLSIIAVSAGVWIVGLFVGWVVAGHALRPIQTISKAAWQISQGNLKERIPLSGSGNELHELAKVLNTTFGRLYDSLERQRQFTADASHELRTPVTIILSETQRMLKMKRSQQEYADSFEICHMAGLRMKKLVENLLLLAREDAGGKPNQPEECRLDTFLEELSAPFAALAAEKAIRIELRVDPIKITTDVFKLSIVLNNLISNAVFHHQGHGNITIKTKKNAEAIGIAIEDDGPGIRKKDLPHIFERFYRGDKSRASNEVHAGLGLAVCQAMAKDLQGEVTVKSEWGQGSVFTLRLPAGS